MAARVDKSLPVGNEGAGIVVAAGADASAQALVGKTVGIIGGAMYSQYRCVPANQALPLPDGTTPADAASWFVNPLTSLGMVETMRLEGHKALVHTAAASNLGQMLQKLCLADDVPLVNIVRKAEQVELLRGMGATHVCNSSEPSFMKDLTDALVTTGATLAFDAIGGGTLAGQILTCMEAAASCERSPVQPLRHDHTQAGVHLRRTRSQPDRPQPNVWYVLGRWRLVAVSVSPEDRAQGRSEAAGTGRCGNQDDFCEQIHARSFSRRGSDARGDLGVRQAGDGRKIFDQPK